jgi:hypothetical protein
MLPQYGKRSFLLHLKTKNSPIFGFSYYFQFLEVIYFSINLEEKENSTVFLFGALFSYLVFPSFFLY